MIMTPPGLAGAVQTDKDGQKVHLRRSRALNESAQVPIPLALPLWRSTHISAFCGHLQP